jgi:hypothetical protein
MVNDTASKTSSSFRVRRTAFKGLYGQLQFCCAAVECLPAGMLGFVLVTCQLPAFEPGMAGAAGS